MYANVNMFKTVNVHCTMYIVHGYMDLYILYTQFNVLDVFNVSKHDIACII